MKLSAIYIMLLSIVLGSCAHGVAKGMMGQEKNDTVDTVLVDTIAPDEYDDELQQYMDENGLECYDDEDGLFFLYPNELKCNRLINGEVVVYRESLDSWLVRFNYHEAKPKENSESAVKLAVTKFLQQNPSAEMYHSNVVPSYREEIYDMYFAMVEKYIGEYRMVAPFMGMNIMDKKILVATGMTYGDAEMKPFLDIMRTVRLN